MDKEPTYSPAEVCEMFGISKSTLLRWEREGSISRVRRHPGNDERRYSPEDVHLIGMKLIPQIGRQFSRTVETDDVDETNRAFETLIMWKFFQGQPFSLETLENYPRLSAESIQKLCRMGLNKHDPHSPLFHRIAKIIARQSEKLSLD